jgi:hypothetical protein
MPQTPPITVKLTETAQVKALAADLAQALRLLAEIHDGYLCNSQAHRHNDERFTIGDGWVNAGDPCPYAEAVTLLRRHGIEL